MTGRLPRLAETSGAFDEAAAAAAGAGLARLTEEGVIDSRDTVVVISTGNGLKDVAGALRGAGEPEAVSPAFEELRVRWEQDVDAREGGDES
jgi:threonine synthase